MNLLKKKHNNNDKIKVKRKRRNISFIILGLLIIGFVFEKSGEYLDSKKFKIPGKLISINGHKMHIYGEGKANNSPTVLFTSGWRTPSAYVDYYPLQKEISKYTRTIVYERPGYGWSEIAKGERDIDTITNELHELLIKNGEKGPFILVGHSFGANEVLRFAQLYSKEVAGVVLIDGSNPDYTVTQKRPSKYLLKYGTVKYTLFNETINALNNFGITRLLFNITDLYISKFTSYKNGLSSAPEELKKLDESMFIKTLNNKNHLQEVRMGALKLIGHNGIGDIPLKVITSSTYNNLELTKNIQQGLLKWSNNSEQIIVENSQHYVHWFNPEIINSEIIEMIRE
ncbi:arylesterase [Clostridium homopropionicum DSM 5847]|uniref:Arylesterase n=1 Tax=Clostridium homopropionicum DSM 5847 TaxID=1121318 RepID=A0A0L6ZAX5_9CLOT|nr:alpha/beta hydrolase [Clostridium homopropionicum]KOA20112.1 arylesterase [Clostridium homopropionicum DSM 5847]SFG99026.1 Pimeloyl-ACP methyl ester carboxylesterase [Clostridium homopropionicum]